MTSHRTILGIKKDSDVHINGLVTIQGDVQVQGNLYIQDNSRIVITGDLITNIIHIGKNANVLIQRTAITGIMNRGKIEVRKSMKIHSMMSLMSNSSLLIHGTLLVDSLANIDIKSKVLMEVRGDARLIMTGANHVKTRMTTIDNSKIHFRRNLFIDFKETNMNEPRVIIGHNSILLVEGHTNALGTMHVLPGASLIMGSFILHGGLCLLDMSSIKVKRSLAIKGSLVTENNCTINVQQKLGINQGNTRIGSNNSLLIGESMNTNANVTIEESSIITAKSFSSGGVSLETNCELIVTNRIDINGRFITGSNCKIIAGISVYINGRHSLFGAINSIETNSIVFGDDTKLISIGNKSLVNVRNKIDLEKTRLQLGSNVIVEAKEILVKTLTTSSKCRVIVGSLWINGEAFIGGNSKIKTHQNMTISGQMITGVCTSINILGNLYVNNTLRIQPMSEVIVTGYSELKSVIACEMSVFIVYGNTEIQDMTAINSRMYFNESLLLRDILVDTDSVLLVTGCLYARDAVFNHSSSNRHTDSIRLSIGGDIYVYGHLEYDKELIVKGKIQAKSSNKLDTNKKTETLSNDTASYIGLGLTRVC